MTTMSEDMRVSGELNKMIQREIETMLDRMETLRLQSKFASFSKVHVPMVLVLGNHSSGKSTFINHMLNQEVQKTGRAPTDCMFTVLMGGKRAERLDGHALSRDNKFGFQDIKGLFGADFVSQVELKVLEDCALLDSTGMMIIDSPGMIDPPGSTTQSRDRTDMDRGYDFKKVVRWLAERADLILVMFDPDKPGTTFESLDVLTTSLNHVNSKVRLILNKVDDFKTVHDFARAYGALCWNLSKVIPRKDMPFIYTMYVPVRGALAPTSSSSEEAMLSSLLHTEFDGTRGEILREVQRAPDLATDNLLTSFKALGARLKMHVTLIEACQREYVWVKHLWHGITMGLIAAGVGVSALYIFRTWGESKLLPATSTSATPSSSGSEVPTWKQDWAKQVAQSKRTFRWSEFMKISGIATTTSLLSWKSGQRALAKMQADVLKWLPALFASTYASFLCKSDRTHDETMATFNSILPGLEMALTQTNLEAFGVFPLAEKNYLDEVLATHVPRLDRCVRDRSGDDYAYLRFKHIEKPSLQQ
ncbi:hypothetical protein H310_06040 [Aphanomyces invadans]|uniref:Dynamin N-terminal domain-containing protein n=1 Tax=Aphanomyces invadans TaxID=157072 RepID=A0A024UAB7_9STRA|nr:hypothetical protein H310_06040 [Aphanomyces invadans]ETW02558.1 hypothetical protein H310_06040 [Aphanomyces invadans]|eukprot:XP_008869163.1 hypothetical protein H310_06040 [Aphanomyces invadans]